MSAMDRTPFTPATSRLTATAAQSPTSKGTGELSGGEQALRGPSTLPLVMEKASPASPLRFHTSSRLKKSFERVKAQVDVDLLHFRRDLVNLLGSATDEEGLSVLQSVVGMVDTCLEQDLGTFKASCQDMVDQLEELRRRCAEAAHRAPITRLLFIITRCSRLVFTEEANSGGRNQHYMTQPRGRLQKGMRHRTDIPRGAHVPSGLDPGQTPAASIRRSTTMPQRWLTEFRRPLAPAPDTDRTAQKPADDYGYYEGTPALSSTGKDFKPSPLGRSVVTALEAQLEKAARSSTLGRQTYPVPALPSSPGAQCSGLKPQKDRRQIKARWSPSTIAEADSPRVHSPGSASSAPASPATPRPPAVAAQQAQQPGDSSPDPSLPSTPNAAPPTDSATLQYSAQLPSADSQQALSRRAHSQPPHPRAPVDLDSSHAEQAPDEPRSQTELLRPRSAQDQGSRLHSMPHIAEPGTGQKGRPRSLTFPLPHQRHLEPSRLSPQTPLTSAPGSHVKGSMSSLAQECNSPDSCGSSSQYISSPMRSDPVCRICDETVPAGTVEDHTLICKDLDRAVNAADGLNERLQRLADCCQSSSREEPSPTHRALLLRLAHHCTSASLVPADLGASPSRACQEALEQCRALRNSEEAHQHVALGACTQRALALVTSKVAQLSCAPSPQPSGEMLHMAGMHQSDVGIEDFEVLKPISRGAFGRVYLAKKRTTGDLYAIKVMRKKDLIRKNLVENACFEKEVMSSANNPFIVRSFYSFTSRDNLFLVMEWISGGDTASLLKSMGALDEDVARQYIAETILALEWCHSQGIIHRDIKPDNLLISAEGHIKAADFGLSCVGVIDRADNLSSDISMLDSDSAPSTPRSMSTSAASSPLRAQPFEAAPRLRFSDDGARRQHWGHSASDPGHRRSTSETGKGRGGPLLGLSPVKGGPSAALSAPSADRKRAMGTPDYLAPEVLLGTGHGSEVDWWSLGVVLFEFVTGCPPFSADSPEEIFDNILNRRLEWPVSDMSAECRDLIDQLLQTDPDTRLGHSGSQALKEHPWFSGLDWDNLAAAKAAFVPQLDCESDTSYFDAKEVSMQSMLMDIGPSEPGSPASMSVDFASAAPGLNPAAFLAGSSNSSTEQPPQVRSDTDAAWHGSAQQRHDPCRGWGSMAESTASAGHHDEWLPRGSSGDDQDALGPEQFLNFSFKNLDLLGRKNQEMASSFRALQDEFGREDPYKET